MQRANIKNDDSETTLKNREKQSRAIEWKAVVRRRGALTIHVRLRVVWTSQSGKKLGVAKWCLMDFPMRTE